MARLFCDRRLSDRRLSDRHLSDLKFVRLRRLSVRQICPTYTKCVICPTRHLSDLYTKCVICLTWLSFFLKWKVALYSKPGVAKARPAGHFWPGEVYWMALGSFLNVMPVTQWLKNIKIGTFWPAKTFLVHFLARHMIIIQILALWWKRLATPVLNHSSNLDSDSGFGQIGLNRIEWKNRV